MLSIIGQIALVPVVINHYTFNIQISVLKGNNFLQANSTDIQYNVNASSTRVRHYYLTEYLRFRQQKCFYLMRGFGIA